MNAIKKAAASSFFTSTSIVAILVGAFLLRLLLSPFGTLVLDQNTFIAWGERLYTVGFPHFYEAWSDYFPGYLYILWVLTALQKIFPIPATVLFKLPAIAADILTGLMVYQIVERMKNRRWALIASALYVFNPAVLANSTLWGQVDSVVAAFTLFTVWQAEKRPALSAIALALGALVKPQAALAAPVVLFVMLQGKWPIKRIVGYVTLAGAIFIAGFVPFAGGKNLATFVLERFQQTLNQYPYTSINAFNFWGLFGMWGKDTVVKQFIGIIVALGVTAAVAIKAFRRQNAHYFLLALILLANFLFFTRMHERHLLGSLAPLVVAASLNPLLLIPFAGLSLTYVANLYYSYQWITQDFLEVFSGAFISLLILANLFFFGFGLWVFWKDIREFPKKFFRMKLKLGTGSVEPNFSSIKLPATPRVILGIILAFALISRLAWLGTPTTMYFDEVYHAFTAKIMKHGDPKAWEWWNPHPTGYAYEWTHPPLAKEFMAGGMFIFGENAFGWRIPAAILGVGVVFLVYLIAKELFADELLALFSAAVMSLDGLVLVMSRIGMNDTYMLFFGLLCIYLFIKKKYSLSAVAFGLSLASKWSALWILPILGVYWLLFSRKWSWKFAAFFVLPPAIYIASYIPMFLTGHSFNIFIGVQKQMWWYHTNLKATHPYTSPWWSWPVLARPIYLYTSEELEGWVARIYAMGNPAVFWGGLVAVLTAFYFAIVARSKKLAFVAFSYFAFFVPWALSPRIMFLYHYLPSIPFLAIATGWFLRRSSKIFVLSFFVVAGLLFLYFFPHWAGLQIPLWLDQSYYWFAGWR